MKSTRSPKKKEKSIQRKINWVVSIILIIFLPIAYIYKCQMLKESGITVGKVINIYLRHGTGVDLGKLARIVYYVDNHRYEINPFWHPGDNNTVGDCFLLEYSLADPQIADVLWEKGKQACMSE